MKDDFMLENLVPDGTISFGPRPIPDDATEVLIEFARCTPDTPDIWPDPNTVIMIDVWVSYDGGKTWPTHLFDGAHAYGGIHQHVKGYVMPKTQWAKYCQPAPGRLVKGDVRVINGPCKTSASFDFTAHKRADLQRPIPTVEAIDVRIV